jgi:hypothetical protein
MKRYASFFVLITVRKNKIGGIGVGNMYCAYCGHPIEEGARYCPSCGKAQVPPVGFVPPDESLQNAAGSVPRPEPGPAAGLAAGAGTTPAAPRLSSPAFAAGSEERVWTDKRGLYLCLFGCLLVALSAFLGVVNITLLSISWWDLSRPASVLLILTALLGAYGAVKGQEPLTLGAGTGALLLFIGTAGYYKYAMVSAVQEAGPFGALVTAAFSLGTGMYVLLLGSVLMLAGILWCGLAYQQLPVGPDTVLQEFWQGLRSPVRFGSASIPAFVIPVVLVVLFVIAVYNVDLDSMADRKFNPFKEHGKESNFFAPPSFGK